MCGISVPYGTPLAPLASALIWVEQQMASWEVKGYVSDSEDDWPELSNVAQRNRDGRQDDRPRLSGQGARCDASDYPMRDPGIPNEVLIADIAQPCPNNSLDHHGHDSSVDNDELSNAAPTTTADKLEASLKQSFDILRDILHTTPSTPMHINDDNDSPLSTPPASPTPSYPLSNPPVTDIVSFDPQAIVHDRPQRNLRQRTANQLNPYSMEYAIYVKACTDRGIKPVRLLRAPSPHFTRQDAQTQGSSFEDESQEQDLPSQDPMDLDHADLLAVRHVPTKRSPIALRHWASDVDDDLPDLNNLLTGAGLPSKFNNYKPTISSTPKREAVKQVFDLPSSKDDTPRSSKYIKRTTFRRSERDSLPSPPRSMSVDLNELLCLSQISPANVALPTPIVSSAPRSRKRRVVEDDSLSNPEFVEPPSPLLVVSSSSEDEPEVGAAQVMQKRVKGVLPASWWSIDRAQQDVKRKRKDEARKAARTHDTVGVARRASKPERRSSLTNIALYDDLTSDEESSSAIARAANDAVPQETGSHLSPRRDDSSSQAEAIEIVDEDGIDPMLATRSRRGIMQRKHQMPLDRLVRNERQLTGRGHGPRSVHEQGGSTLSTYRPRKRKPNTLNDRVRVLDAPDLCASNTKTRPRFLRVAARQVKGRSSEAGTSASSKFLQLATEEDNADILRDFETWKRGSRVLQPHSVRPSDASEERRSHWHGLRKSIAVSTPGLDQRPGIPEHAQTAASLQQRNTLTRGDGQQTGGRGPLLGTIVQCEPSEEATLRLTRLRTLLPLTNRSGQGRFALQRVEPRIAQAEVIRPVLRGPKRSTLLSPENVLAPNQPIRASPGGRESERDHYVASLPTKDPRKWPRKQQPQYRRHLEQTLLAPNMPDKQKLEAVLGSTGLRVQNVLETEFANFQAAWFQGSKSGMTVANAKTQQHFHVFIEVLKSYLPSALQDASDGREARELRSFLHRLIPNRGQIGAQGQIGDKMLEVLEYDILVARNVFELHACLLNLAPGCAPRPRVLEMKVNFSDAHHEICLIALSTWLAIWDCHHIDPSIVEGLNTWLFSMLSQSLTRWHLAELDARREATERHVDEQVIRRVIEYNRTQAVVLLLKAVELLSQGIRSAVSASETDLLFDMKRFFDFLNGISRISDMDSSVFVALFKVPLTYVDQQWAPLNMAKVANMLDGLRQDIGILTSTLLVIAPSLQHAMIKAYFITANIAVRQHQKNWGDFTNASSAYSLKMFVSGGHLDALQTYFFHFLLESDLDHYCMELRNPVFTQWLRMLLGTHGNMEACGLLTASVLRQEKQSLSIQALAREFHDPEIALPDSRYQQLLPEIRHAAVMHIIAELHRQDNNPEANWLPGGIDNRDAVHLLRTMFSTMKATWLSLNEEPEEQDVYTILIHEALDQYAIHSRTDYTIEPWFYNSAVFPQPNKHALVKFLTNVSDIDDEVVQTCRKLFYIETSHAMRYDRIEQLSMELKTALSSTTFDGLEIEAVIRISFKHTHFIKSIVPAVWEGGRMRHMLLNLLRHVSENLEWWPESCLEASDGLVMALIPVIAIFREMFDRCSDEERQMVYGITECLLRWSTVLQDLPETVIADMGTICARATEEDTEGALSLLHTAMEVA